MKYHLFAAVLVVALSGCGDEAQKLNDAADRAERAAERLESAQQAMDDMLEDQHIADESAASATLRAGLFNAQRVFQADGYMDADGDGVGEYAPEPRYLAGWTDDKLKYELSLMSPRDWNAAQPLTLNGYTYTMTAGADPEAAWSVVAVPAAVPEGATMRALAISQAGQLVAQPFVAGQTVVPSSPWSDDTFTTAAAGWEAVDK